MGRQRNQRETTNLRRPSLSKDAYVSGIRRGDRAVLARAITLVESRRPDHAAMAQEVLSALLPHTGDSQRIGITGVPGVGKSTLIETLGIDLVQQNHRVAVLAVDPTSPVSGGSILGDKSRMERLSTHPSAFVRPSPNAQTPGGVGRRTRETMLLCEAAGFDVILIETVGVGQCETLVEQMVDFFLVLMLPGAGDELQGIKKGILELADAVAINKADGDNLPRAIEAKRALGAALRYTRAKDAPWQPNVIMVSALSGMGIADLWQTIAQHRAVGAKSGVRQQRRRSQRGAWMWTLIKENLMTAFCHSPAVREQLDALHEAVCRGTQTPTAAASSLVEAFLAERPAR